MRRDEARNENPLILLVDDNPDHTELVLRSLREHRAAPQVEHVSDGQAALDYLFGSGEAVEAGPRSLPHLVLLDLRLPKIDGLEVLHRIKTCEALKSLPVVILTSSEAESDVRRAYHLCANSYLVKPTDFDKFSSLMRDLGLYWLVWNKKPPE